MLGSSEFGYRRDQFAAPPFVLPIELRDTDLDGFRQRRESIHAGRLGSEGGQDNRLKFIRENQQLLAGEVAEEGSRGDIRRRRDLLGSRFVIALRAEQPQPMSADRGSGSYL